MGRLSGKWAAEFILIVIGVLAALAVDDWRDARADVAVEEHLLRGLRADADRDLQDLSVGIDGAKARIAGVNELLRRIGDPDVALIRVPPIDVGQPVQQLQRILRQDLNRQLEQAEAAYPPGSLSAQEALLLATTMTRFDVADATYVEATASGQLDVVRDLDVRSEIAQYYHDVGRFGPTVDNRVEASVERLVRALARDGLSGAANASDLTIEHAIRGRPGIVAELKNVRYWAAYQMERHEHLMSLTSALARRLDDLVR